jgi:putative flippase GtrA
MVLSRPHFWELVRFAAVGIASTGVYFGLLWLFTVETNLSLGVRATLAYGIDIAFNYAMQRSFTFRSARQHQHAGPRFLAVHIGGMAINTSVLWLGVDHEHWPYLPVQCGALVLTTLWSYAGQKFWAFFSAPNSQA